MKKSFANTAGNTVPTVRILFSVNKKKKKITHYEENDRNKSDVTFVDDVAGADEQPMAARSEKGPAGNADPAQLLLVVLFQLRGGRLVCL